METKITYLFLLYESMLYLRWHNTHTIRRKPVSKTLTFSSLPTRSMLSFGISLSSLPYFYATTQADQFYSCSQFKYNIITKYTQATRYALVTFGRRKLRNANRNINYFIGKCA
jgi:hypothetical protein